MTTRSLSPRQTGYDDYERARAALRAGRFKEAERLIHSVLRRNPDPELRARCLISQALSAGERGSVADGLNLCREAEAITGIPPAVRGLAHAQEALLLVRSADQAAALRAFARAESLLHEIPEELTSLHLNRGVLYLNLERADAALADFEHAHALAATLNDEVLSAKARFNLGMAEAQGGNLVAGLRHLEAVAPILNPLSRNYEAVGESCLGEILAASGLMTEAAEKFAVSARIFGEEGLRQDQAEMELLWAQLMSRADPAAARRSARTAARRFRARGALDWELRAEIAELAMNGTSASGSLGQTRRSSRRRLERASSLYDRAVARGLSFDAEICAQHAAMAAAAAGEHTLAKHWLRRTRRRGGEPMALRLHRAEARAMVAAARGDRAASLEALRAGLDDLHQWLSGFGSSELQAALVGHGRELALAGLGHAVSTGRPELVFEWFERARVLITRVSPVRPPVDAGAAGELAQLRALHARGEDDAELRERIRRHAWYAPARGPSAQPARLGHLREGLGEAGMLSLVSTQGDLLALWVTAERTGVTPVARLDQVTDRLAAIRADLDMVAGELPASLAAVVKASLRERLGELDRLLLGELRPVLETRDRWVVIPAAAIAATPWVLLPSLRGRTFTLARSSTHWLANRAQAWNLQRVGLVTGPQVRRAEEEVQAALGPWPPTQAEVASMARADEVSALAERVDVLHLAAHGQHAADNPLFSGLLLSDGPWFGYDVDQLSRVPAAVILSACELGRSQARAGEQLLGMTTAWLHAGARCVIASPALVSDDAACELLPEVHRGLAAGLPPAVALAAAHERTDVLAPFACFGSGW